MVADNHRLHKGLHIKQNKVISYYFDFLSPYSYLSWHWVRKQVLDQKLSIDLIPVFMIKVIKNYTDTGPAEIPPKRDYLFKTCQRVARQNLIPFNIPGRLPFNSLHALRLSLKETSNKQFEIIDAIFMAGWAEGRDIGDKEVLKDILLSIKLPADELMDKISGKECGLFLKENTKNAISNNVFGVPTFIADNELFWGNDSIPFLEMFLHGKDLLNDSDLEMFVDFQKSYDAVSKSVRYSKENL